MEEIVFENITIIIAVNLALYFKTLRYKFVSDDFSVFHNPPVVKNPIRKAWLRLTGQGKWMSRTVVFFKDSGRWKASIIKSEEFEHLLAIIIHTLLCVAMYFAFGRSNVSFMAALLYSTNPVNNQGTIWPGGRGYALPALMLMLSVIFPLISPLFLAFCTWYTVGFLYPLALIGSPWWPILLALPFVWALHFRKFRTAVSNKRNAEVFDEDRVIHPRKLILGIKTLGFYFTLCLIPFRITFYHNFLQSAAGSLKHKCYTLCRYFWVGACLLAGLTVYSYFSWGILAWAVWAFVIAIGPFTNIIRANQEIAERFAAPANVFLMYALAILISGYPSLCAAFLVFYATRTFYTLIMYKDEYYITEVAVIEDPHAWWAWHCRAMKRWDTQSYKEALILWVMARLISPKEFKLLINIATALKFLGNSQEGDAYLKLAEDNIIPGQEEQALEIIEQYKRGKMPILL